MISCKILSLLCLVVAPLHGAAGPRPGVTRVKRIVRQGKQMKDSQASASSSFDQIQQMLKRNDETARSDYVATFGFPGENGEEVETRDTFYAGMDTKEAEAEERGARQGYNGLGGLGTTQLGLGGVGYGGLGGYGSLGSLGGLGNIGGVGNLGNIGIGGAGNIGVGLGVGVPQQIRYQEINSVPLGIVQPYVPTLGLGGLGLGGGLGGYGGGLGGYGGAFVGIPVITGGSLLYGGTGGLGLGLGSLRGIGGLGNGLLRREDRALEGEGTQLEDNEVEKKQ